MKKIKYLSLCLVAICAISCGNKSTVESALDVVDKATEMGEKAYELGAPEDSDEDATEDESASEKAEDSKEDATEEEQNAGDSKLDKELSDLDADIEDLIKKCDKIGEGVGILDIQTEQVELTEKIEELNKEDLSSSQRKRLDKLTIKLTKVATKTASSTIGTLFGN